MKIALISRSWPPVERSGVSLASESHAHMLIEQGHEVFILGSKIELTSPELPACPKFLIDAKGSGSLYSPARINKTQIEQVLLSINPDLVIVEAWQTALTDAAIDTANWLGLPVMLISHGISVHAFSCQPVQLLRAVGWLIYRLFRLPRLIRKLSLLTVLDTKSTSDRFYDRKLATQFGIPTLPLKNAPRNFVKSVIPRDMRETKVLVVGYFSPIKNQLGALKALKKLPHKIQMMFIGDRVGNYFHLCQKLSIKEGFGERVILAQDDEVNVASQIAGCGLVFAPSLTEALPMTLIEAMACGTPFVATPVGAISGFRGGILANSVTSQVKAIVKLIEDPVLWQNLSDIGRMQYENEFSHDHISSQLAKAVQAAVSLAPMQT